MERVDYTKLTDQELLARADTDSGAIVEIVNRQRAGKAQRLYVGPRQGALDDGVTGAILRIDEKLGVVLDIGKSNSTVLMPKTDMGVWMIHAYKSLMQVLRSLQQKGASMQQAKEWSDQVVTSDFDLGITIQDENTAQITFHPDDRRSWVLGPTEVHRFISSMTVAIDLAGWSPEDCGVDDRWEKMLLEFIIGGGGRQ